MSAKFTVFKDKGGKFRFNLKAANGEIIAACSEGYPDKKSALKGIASIAKNAPIAKIDDTTIEAAARKPVKKTVAAKKPEKKPAAVVKPAIEKPAADKCAETCCP